MVTLELVGETRLSHPPHLLYIKRHINPTPTLCPTGWTTSRGVCSKHLTRLQPPPLHSPLHNHPKLPDRELESQTEKLQRRAAARVSSSSLLTVDPRVGGTVRSIRKQGWMKAALFTLMPLLSSRLSKFSWAAINPSHLTHPPPPPEKHIRPGAVRVCGSETIRRGVGRARCFLSTQGWRQSTLVGSAPTLRSKPSPNVSHGAGGRHLSARRCAGAPARKSVQMASV